MQAVIISEDADEKEILSFILRKAGLAVAISSDYKRVLESWTDHPADLMIIVVKEGQVPEKVVEEVRADSQVPLLMLIESLTEKTFCSLLFRGADAVLRYPVSPQELSAQVTAMMRRSNTVPSFVLPTLELDEIVLDPSNRTVTLVGDNPKRLTRLEFQLLYTLMTNRGQVVPMDILVERVWGYTGEGNEDLVRGLISRLRRKVEPDGEIGRFIETIPGVGYRFTIDTY
ncbi:MAG TPA: response regulator transcription factor [Anaerolineae bacterium]|nr:response regulator transcription factor [Anaerolineae bacterium]